MNISEELDRLTDHDYVIYKERRFVVVEKISQKILEKRVKRYFPKLKEEIKNILTTLSDAKKKNHF
jgi:hypothetical protein